jgi:hypothetical protein
MPVQVRPSAPGKSGRCVCQKGLCGIWPMSPMSQAFRLRTRLFLSVTPSPGDGDMRALLCPDLKLQICRQKTSGIVPKGWNGPPSTPEAVTFPRSRTTTIRALRHWLKAKWPRPANRVEQLRWKEDCKVRPASPAQALARRCRARAASRLGLPVTILRVRCRTPRRRQSVPRPAFGVAMLTLLRLPS